MKAWILYVPTRHNTEQPAQVSVHSETTGNIDSSIKLRKFTQRFAVSSAKRLHAHNVFQFFSFRYVQRAARHGAMQLEHSKYNVHPFNNTTITRASIAKRTVCSKEKTYKGNHRASLRPVPSHSNVLGSTRRVWHYRMIRQCRYTTKRENKQEKKLSPKQQTIKKHRGQFSNKHQRNLRNGGINMTAHLQFIGMSNSISEELMSS